MHSVFKIYIFLCMVAQTTFAMEPVGYTEEERQKKNIIDMCDAAESGRINLVKACLQEGTPIDAHRLGRPALYFCLRRQHLDIAQLLWANGTNIDAACRNGCTVLEELICDLDLPTDQRYKNGIREGIRWLIGKGAHLEKANTRDHTLYHTAMCIGDWHAAIILRNAGANIYSHVENENVTLQYIFCNFKSRMIQYLLWEGPPIKKESKKACCDQLREIQNYTEESNNKYQQINTVIQLLESTKLPQIPEKARSIFMQEATKGKNIAPLLRYREIGKR